MSRIHHRLAAAAAIGSTLAVASAQQVVHVAAGATGANNGSSWVDAYTDLQAALGAAPVGSELWVAAGTYRASLGDQAASFALRSGVALYGGFGGGETARWQRDPAAHATVLDGDLAGDDVQGTGLGWWQTANGYGNNTYRIVVGSGVDATAVLDGFTITHGWASSGATAANSGGGLFLQNSSARIVDCTFEHDIAYWGGGAIAIAGGSPVIEDCRFVENMIGDGRGGAVAVGAGAQATLRGCEFRRNTARSSQQGVGGGLYIATGSTAVVDRCRFVGNLSRNFYALGQSWPAIGGAVYNGGVGTPFTRCTFVDNQANAGGGIFSYAAFTAVHCLLDDNDVVAYNGSGGISMGGFGGGLAGIGLVNNPAMNVRGCTFVNGNASDDGGGAYFNGASGQVTGSVFWNNTDSVGQVNPSQCRGHNPRWSCVQNLMVPAPGEDPIDPLDFPGSFDLNPQFVDFDGPNNVPGDEDDDLRLAAGSPCIDRADPNATDNGLDVAGVPRWLDGDGDGALRLDCGAHEFTHVHVAVAQQPAGGGATQVMFTLTGTAGLPAFLALGAAGPGFVLPPFGGIFLDLASPPVVMLLGLPAGHTITAGAIGAEFTVQAVTFANGLGTTSNPVTFRL